NIIYLIFFIILEINSNQIILMNSDKLCNYYLFQKIGPSLFNNINIIKNNKSDTIPIKDLKVLCYIIYFISCMLTKYNIWKPIGNVTETKHKFNPVTQKTIINTL